MDTRLLHPWDFSGKDAGVGCHFFLHGIFLTQWLNQGLPHCRQTLYHLSHQGSRKAMINLDSLLKSRDITLPTKVHLVKAMVFPVVMYRCESWTIKKAERQRTDIFKQVLEKTLENPLDCKEIQSVYPKWNQSWIFIGRTDAEAETPTFWPPDSKSWLTGKDPDAGKDWGQEKRMTEDEMIR